MAIWLAKGIKTNLQLCRNYCHLVYFWHWLDNEEVIILLLWGLFRVIISLTHKELETHECKLSPAATDALALKHQAISIYSAY